MTSLQDLCVSLFIAELFTIVKNLETIQNCSSRDSVIQLWCIYTMESSKAIKKSNMQKHSRHIVKEKKQAVNRY